MPKLKRLSGQDVIKILAAFGFAVAGQKGSHVKLVLVSRMVRNSSYHSRSSRVGQGNSQSHNPASIAVHPGDRTEAAFLQRVIP